MKRITTFSLIFFVTVFFRANSSSRYPVLETLYTLSTRIVAPETNNAIYFLRSNNSNDTLNPLSFTLEGPEKTDRQFVLEYVQNEKRNVSSTIPHGHLIAAWLQTKNCPVGHIADELREVLKDNNQSQQARYEHFLDRVYSELFPVKEEVFLWNSLPSIQTFLPLYAESKRDTIFKAIRIYYISPNHNIKLEDIKLEDEF